MRQKLSLFYDYYDYYSYYYYWFILIQHIICAVRTFSCSLIILDVTQFEYPFHETVYYKIHANTVTRRIPITMYK